MTTVEGLSSDGALSPLQQTFLDEQAGQCGYCLSGILISAAALLAHNPRPSRSEIAAALDRHLCRCGVQSHHAGGRTRRRGDGSAAVSALPKSLADNPLLSTWIGFEEAGRVRLATGKVEIGQGVLTALAQIAAEEFDARRSACASYRARRRRARRRASPRAATRSPYRGVPFASPAPSARALPRACCTSARLPDRGARDRGRTLPADGPPDRSGLLVDGRQVDLARPRPAPLCPSRRRLSRRRAEPVAARSRGQSPGRGLHPRPRARERAACAHAAPPLAGRAARRARRGCGARAAGAPIDILRAGDLVALTSDDETAVMRASQSARMLAVWDGGTKPRQTRARRTGSRARARATGPKRARRPRAGNRVIEARFSRPFLTYGSIAPSCALARFSGGELQVWTHSQGVFELRKWLARTLAIDEARITVFHRQGAGCYGHNSADDAAFDAAFVAMRVPERTVRVQWTREDEFTAAPMGSAMVVGLRAVLDANRARPTGRSIWSPVHAQRPGMNGSANFIGAQALPDAAPPPAEINDVADAAAAARPATGRRSTTCPPHDGASPPPGRSGAHLVAARARRLANVFAIDLHGRAEAAGEDPVAYGSRSSPIRARGGWSRPRPRSPAGRRGCARWTRARLRLCPLQEPRRLCGGGGRGRMEEEVRVTRWAAVDAGLVINPDGAENQIEAGSSRPRAGRSRSACASRTAGSPPSTWGGYPILRFRGAGGRDPLHRRAERAGAGPGRGFARTDRRRHRQRGGARARHAHPRSAVDARAHHGDAACRALTRTKVLAAIPREECMQLRSAFVLAAGLALALRSRRARRTHRIFPASR